MKSGLAFAPCPVCDEITHHIVAALGDEVVAHCRSCRDTHLLQEMPPDLLRSAPPPAQPAL